MVEAKWTGSYPNLCSGVWELTIDGEDFSLLIPHELRYSPMGTAGIYQSWRFNEDWDEIFESYVDGLKFEDWIAKNPWVAELPCSPRDIYDAFQENDWRHGSCGGCI